MYQCPGCTEELNLAGDNINSSLAVTVTCYGTLQIVILLLLITCASERATLHQINLLNSTKLLQYET